MTEQNITIAINTDSGIFNGIITLPGGTRLSDFVNSSAQFLHLRGGQVNNSTDIVSNLDEIHINKKAIKTLTTATKDDARGAAVKEKRYPYVQKKTVSVKIYMTDYEISGNLYSCDEGSISQCLEKTALFLPCTDVNILDIRNNSSLHADFIAINLNNISALQKVEN
jgi:hypothetical protein